ncbi:hypothetical protein KEH51_27845 [[Brevibacterium] frigoritolerans]|uniref:Uncharacterized protein n=1 Tax=Peribacillus frigoritolerans TaxID=450367 RepID=A0A941FRG1_9BACI|nr:hypothetical protein [Peribacillus frigoritolerans]
MEPKVRDSCGKSASREDPTGESRGRTARGKRVPYVPINVQIVQTIKRTNSILSLSAV